MYINSLFSPILWLSPLSPSYHLPSPFQWQGHQFGPLWIAAVGWSFVTLAAAVLSFGMMHMAHGLGMGLWAAYMSCCLFHSGNQTLHGTHQSPMTQVLTTALLPIPLLSWRFWHVTVFEAVWEVRTQTLKILSIYIHATFVWLRGSS